MARRATAFEYVALVALGVGALAAVLVVLPYRAFDLDRFLAPKELALHIAALVAAVVLLAGLTRVTIERADAALASWLVLSALSALFASNHWLAFRALSITVSGALVFWSARRLAATQLADALTVVLALAVVAGAVTALAQAYGVKMEFASLNRAPGGTFGNRNFMAHLTAFGVPILIYRIAIARWSVTAVLWSVALSVCSAAIVLSRTRAAWLALAACGALGIVIAVRGPALFELPGARRRAWSAVGAAALGIVLALAIPNTLDWHSASPYLDSAKSVVNFREGSGKGRVRQYQNSLRLALAHPVLGVGPGNWPVAYPRIAPGDDPSLFEGTGTTMNPWPSSDWVGAISERGLPAALAYAGFVALLIIGAIRTRYDASRLPRERLAALVGAGVLGIAVVEGGFDAVLLLSTPAVIVWAAAGALIPPRRTIRDVQLARRSRTMLTLAAATVCVMAALTTAGRISAMELYSTGTIAGIEKAARRDPGSYRVRLRAAEAYAGRGDCTNARRHALAARGLLPSAVAPKRVLAQCP